MSQINPYEPPRSQVADVGAAAALGTFVEGGRAVEAGHGWTWIAAAFDLFRKRPGAWIIITIILGVGLIVVNMLPILGFVLNTLLMPVLAGGILLGCRALENDGEFGVGDLFSGFSDNTGRLIMIGVATIIAWIVILVPLVLFMGRSLFALMGGDPSALAAAGAGMAIAFLVMLGLSIPIYMALWFAPCLVVFNEMGPRQALMGSFRACLKNIVPFLVYGVMMVILFVIAAIPLGLGLLVAVPVLIASVYTAYREIFYSPD